MDVARALGCRDTDDAVRLLDDDEVNTHNVSIAGRGGWAPLVVSEPGLYKLIQRSQSRWSEAQEFARRVAHEVAGTV